MADRKWKFRDDMLGHYINGTSNLTFQNAEDRLNDLEERIQKVNELLKNDSQIDGAHHKAWCIDQIARIINGEKYEEFIHAYECLDDDGKELPEDERYQWDEGIAP